MPEANVRCLCTQDKDQVRPNKYTTSRQAADCLKIGAGYVESSRDNHARCVQQLFALNIRHSNKVYVQQGQVLKC